MCIASGHLGCAVVDALSFGSAASIPCFRQPSVTKVCQVAVKMNTDTRHINHKLLWLPALFAVELVMVALVFQVFTHFECQQTEFETACRALRSVMVRAYCLTAAMCLFIWIRVDLRKMLISSIQTSKADRGWVLVHFAGVALLFVPWILASADQLTKFFPFYFLSLSIGGTVALLGGLFWLMPAADWKACVKSDHRAIAAVCLVAILVPDFADLLAFAWTFEILVLTTFYGVGILLTLLGQPVSVGFAPPSIGSNDFIVEIASSCSGVEGLALITGFFAIYTFLMRGSVNAFRLWLIVWPIALVASWLLNIVRITTLILIGATGSPDLAVNGFHSFAGWLFFSALALGVIAFVQTVPWLHNPKSSETPVTSTVPLRDDQVVAYIVPFILFMLIGLILNAFWLYPELGYPVLVILLTPVIWYFRRAVLAGWDGIDPFAFLAGLGVGVGWVLLAEPNAETLPGLATLSATATVAWVAFRIFGTVVIIPIVEEAFFRGYLLDRLNAGGAVTVVFAVAVSSLTFAALHGRILEAGIAGVVFSLIMLRRRNLIDAILCHATANGFIAVAAMLNADWSLI